MLILRPIGPGVVDYYRQGQDPGRWLGGGAERLGLGGRLDPESLGRILVGRHPGTGEQIGHTHPHRQAGWGLIFAAPKSVSLLAAVAPLADAHRLIDAHQAAVAGTMDWFETEMAGVVRGGERVAAGGVVAARFEHGGAANGDPHLHSHILVANLAQGPEGRWSALDGSFWPERRGIGAIYDLALRDEISGYWPGLRWHVDHRGLADVVGVPRAAIEAVSARHLQLRAELGDAVATPRRAHLAATRTRREPATLDWRTRLGRTGFEADDAAALLSPLQVRGEPGGERGEPGLRRGEPGVGRGKFGREPLAESDVGLAETAEAWLTERAPVWTRSVALQALAATAERGTSPASAVGVVARVCDRSRAVTPGRWTTAAARRLDEAVAAAATARDQRSHAGHERLVAEVLEARPQLPPAAAIAVKGLVYGDATTVVLTGVAGRDRLVEQAAVVEAARAVWELAGTPVVVDARPDCGARWNALTGLGGAVPGKTPGVIVADRADHRTGRELLGLLGQAAAVNAKVILVEGGTIPARRFPYSEALRRLQRVELPVAMALEPPRRGPSPAVESGPAAEPGAEVVSGAVESGRVVVCATAGDAFAAARAQWEGASAGRRPVLVGLGPPEAEALNCLARTALIAAGEVADRHVTLWGRDFAAGDRVLARRPGPVPSASLGTVDSVSPNPPTMTVRWDGRDEATTTIGAWDAQRLVHGYAVTAGVAARLTAPLVLLGDPREVPRLAGRDLTAVVVAPRSTHHRDPFDRVERLAELAASGARAGPDGRTATGRARQVPLATLVTRRDRLEADLRAGLPPDVAGLRRRLAEDRAYTAAPPDPGSPQPGSLAAQDALIERAEAALSSWLATNGDRLVQWHDLGRLIECREDLIAHAATLDPTSRAQALTGPEPAEQALRPAWRRAVRRAAVSAERSPERALREGRPMRALEIGPDLGL